MVQRSLLALGLLPLTCVAFDKSLKDPNSYPWGDNPNNDYKMYWKDAPNVLNSLSEFKALYIKVHGCVWSEYGKGETFDDDGENHDGDENWYMSRVQPFRANTAFSLYGELKGTVNLGFNCRKGTYINTFFTYEGADTLLKAFENDLTAFPERPYGSAYCYDEDWEQKQWYYNRNKNSGDGDDDGQDTISQTMGCTAFSNFELANFQGSGCDGMSYINTTDSLWSYNFAQSKHICSRVWNYGEAMRNVDDDDDSSNPYYYVPGSGASTRATYGSIVETLLESSFACDITLYPHGLCPDPYGLKAKYDRNIIASARNGQPTRLFDWQSRMISLSQLFLLIGGGLAIFSYIALRREIVKTNGGGFKGWFNQFKTDTRKACIETQKWCLGNPTLARRQTNARSNFNKQASTKSLGSAKSNGSAKSSGSNSLGAKQSSVKVSNRNPKRQMLPERERSERAERGEGILRNNKNTRQGRKVRRTRSEQIPTERSRSEQIPTERTRSNQFPPERVRSDRKPSSRSQHGMKHVSSLPPSRDPTYNVRRKRSNVRKFSPKDFMGVPIPAGVKPGRKMNVQLVPGDPAKAITVPKYSEWRYSKKNQPYFLIPTAMASSQAVKKGQENRKIVRIISEDDEKLTVVHSHSVDEHDVGGKTDDQHIEKGVTDSKQIEKVASDDEVIEKVAADIKRFENEATGDKRIEMGATDDEDDVEKGRKEEKSELEIV